MSINFNLFIILLLWISVASCNPNNEPQTIFKNIKTEYYSEENENLKKSSIDKYLLKIENVLKLHPKNTDALRFKLTLLFRNRDISASFLVLDELLEVYPLNVDFLAQKGLLLEIAGKEIEAQKYYNKCIRLYEEELAENSLDWNWNNAYLLFLQTIEENTKEKMQLKAMRHIFTEEWQTDIIDSLESRVELISKDQLTKYWNGEIAYGDLVDFGKMGD